MSGDTGQECTDPTRRSHYGDFVIAMAYGERPEFKSLLEQSWRWPS